MVPAGAAEAIRRGRGETPGSQWALSLFAYIMQEGWSSRQVVGRRSRQAGKLCRGRREGGRKSRSILRSSSGGGGTRSISRVRLAVYRPRATRLFCLLLSLLRTYRSPAEDFLCSGFFFLVLFCRCMIAQWCRRQVAMDLGVYQLRHFSISFLSSLLGTDSSALRLDSSSSGASVVAIDNKIEQAMDLVKSHLMYAVREEVEVLKEQIKELIEKNNQLEQENNLLKTLASPEQLAQFQAQLQTSSSSSPASSQPQGTTQQPPSQPPPPPPGSGPSA
ncbi:TSC22 domain family protein 1 isoform X4 [Pogona vitticeps]